MQIVLLLSNELKQRYVIRALAKRHQVLGVVTEDRYTPGYRFRTVLKHARKNPFKIICVVYQKLKLRRYEVRDKRIIESWFLKNGKPIEIDKKIPVKIVKNVNQEDSVEFIKNLAPELIVVFGTSLIKKEIISIPEKAIINVHTGLSPYYRGGQCAFWCLYNDEPEYIGVTVHYLDEGIDSGDIIIQGRPEIEEDDCVTSIECKLAILATELLIKAIGQIEEDKAKGVPQTTKGKFYLSKAFTLDKRLGLEKRLRQGLIKRYLERKGGVYNKVEIVEWVHELTRIFT